VSHRARPPSAADVWAEMLMLPVWDVPGLRVLVHAAPRPCWGADPEVFHPAGESGPGVAAAEAAARRVCAGCPVRGACAALALSPTESHTVLGDGTPAPVAYAPDGVYGGLTAAERRVLAPAWRSLRRLAAGGPARVDVPAVSSGAAA
jgi:Transcription factor WhiB